MDQSEAIREVVDQPALDRHGEDVGRVVEVFVDENTSAPTWVALKVEGRDSVVLAPVARADLEARPFRLDVDRAHVLSAPTLASGEQRISPEEEAEIERHYREATVSAGSAREDEEHTEHRHGVRDEPLAADTPLEVVRSEEDLVVGTRVVGTERVRLIKRIVTEEVTRTVEVRHEELVIEREPLSPAEQTAPESSTAPTDASGTRRERISERLKEKLPSLPAGALSKIGSGGAFSGETTEIILNEEEVIVSKRIVPRERVRVHKEVVTEHREIADTLRKEQVEIEQGPGIR